MKKNIKNSFPQNLSGKKVLLRVDFNAPLSKQTNSKHTNGKYIVSDDTRLKAALPSLNLLRKRGAALILMSHAGRPKGKPEVKFSLKPMAKRLGELMTTEVKFSDDCIGEQSLLISQNLNDGEILLLENLRFHNEEKANDENFAAELAKHADYYVNDAFGTAHRAHASTVGVAKIFKDKAAIGLLMQRELDFLVGKLANPARPFVAILGGAKVSDKIGVITALLEKCDSIIIGGAMAYTFLKAKGEKVGKSLVEEDRIKDAKNMIIAAGEKGVELLLPIDSIAADAFSPDAKWHEIKGSEGIDNELMGLDIGSKSRKIFAAKIKDAACVLWNGPMGVFEMPAFAEGTKAIANAVAQSSALSIIGGGDSVAAIKKFGFEDKVDFISTGGGASLQLLEGKKLPALEAIEDA